MDLITLILIAGFAANAFGFAVLILAGPVYAWNDDPRSGEWSKT